MPSWEPQSGPFWDSRKQSKHDTVAKKKVLDGKRACKSISNSKFNLKLSRNPAAYRIKDVGNEDMG
jgi:hypothetical protein